MSLADLLFDAFMYPLEAVALRRRRRELIREAHGVVLEIGAGTGANLRHYRWGSLRELHLLDTAPGDGIREGDRLHGVPVVTHQADALALPFADATFDTVVSTLVLCSVAEQGRCLSEIGRVLKARGILLFLEHVRPARPRLARVADALNPIWFAMNGSCNVNRDTLRAMREAGFVPEEVSRDGGGLLVGGVATRPTGAPSPAGR